MKTKSTDTRLIPFPTPESGSALAAVRPPSVPAFPRGWDGNDLIVAVPVLLMVSVWSVDNTVESMIADAVAVVRDAEIVVRGAENEEPGVPVECVSLANSDQLHVLPLPAIGNRFFSLVSEAVESVCESMKQSGGFDAIEIDRVASRTLEVLHLLNVEDSSRGAVAS